MPRRVEERVPAITPQLAWRVAVLGGVALALFAVVCFRLWYLQVLTGDQYVAAAVHNRARRVPIEAPRGDIVDRGGTKLVTTRLAAVVQIAPTSLPKSVLARADDYRKALALAQGDVELAKGRLAALRRRLGDDGRPSTKAERAALRRLRAQSETARRVPVPAPAPAETALASLYRRLAGVIREPPDSIHEAVIRGVADAPYTNVTIKTDVQRAQYGYLRENADRFPGVVVETRYLRDYPHDELAAQLFGTVSKQAGQSGLEARYDASLRGAGGHTTVTVDALGARDDRTAAKVTQPVQGARLRLTLDHRLQLAGDAALARAIAGSGHPGSAGAYVALDPRDGAILAMGSQPSFDANRLAKPFSQRTWELLTSNATSAPLIDRAYQSVYPTGSVFKPITALAALRQGLVGRTEIYDDTGAFQVGTQRYQNAKAARFGRIGMSDALKVSSDIFFFRLGALANFKPLIQREARNLGFGRRTGIDVPGEAKGLVPDSAWRAAGYAKYQACVAAARLALGSDPALLACGGIDKPWTKGDNVNLAVGQGDLQATPLQVAVAYAALENGGTIVRPHLGAAIGDRPLPFPPRGKVRLDAHDRAVVLDGLRRAANEEDGTSADVFDGFPKRYTVYGKTGTAERGIDLPDQAWYACFVPDRKRPIVVVVTLEQGGFGAQTAAPAARLILSQWFGVRDRRFHAGSSVTL